MALKLRVAALAAALAGTTMLAAPASAASFAERPGLGLPSTMFDASRYNPAAQSARWGEPARGSYRGVAIYETPAPTQGFTVLEMLNLLDGQVQFLITECSLPQVLYYNDHYPENICDVGKTRAQILECYKQHNNINILVERGEKKYVHTGRFQDEEQAREVDRGLRATLVREGLHFTSLAPDVDAINAFARTLLD